MKFRLHIIVIATALSAVALFDIYRHAERPTIPAIRQSKASPDVAEAAPASEIEPAATGSAEAPPPQLRSPDSVAEESDLFQMVQRLAASAYDNQASAQLAIAEALSLCEDALAFSGVYAEPFVATQAARCKRFKEGSPFNSLPPPASQYTFRYWIDRAYGNDEPVAVAWRASLDIVTALTVDQALVERVERDLMRAVRSGNEDTHFHVANALAFADRRGRSDQFLSERGAAWYLVACRTSTMCTESPQARFSDTCRLGSAAVCDPNAAFVNLLETSIGAMKFSEAYQRSLLIEDQLARQSWEELEEGLRLSK